MKPLSNLSEQLHGILDLCMQINAHGAEHAHFDLSPHVCMVFVSIYLSGHVYEEGQPSALKSLSASYEINWEHLTPEEQADRCQQELGALIAALHERLPGQEAAA